jgi:hypothetical protein
VRDRHQGSDGDVVEELAGSRGREADAAMRSGIVRHVPLMQPEVLQLSRMKNGIFTL